jgi:bacillithiol system protein YtxJ
MKAIQNIHSIEDWNTCKETIPESGLLIFKYSPVCPISRGVERSFDAWFADLKEETDLLCVKVDVKGDRPLSQQLAKELNIPHESPQAIWLNPDLTVRWHDNHRAIRADALNSCLSQ